MRAYLRLFAIQMRISIGAAAAYRANFVIQGCLSLVWIALTLLPLFVLYRDRDTVNGWDAPAALVVIGCFITLRAVLDGIVNPSLVELVDRIRTGAFDYVLLKPIDAQALVSASRCEPWKVFDLCGGLGVIGYAFALRGTPPAPADLALGAVYLLAGGVAMYALWIACAAASFWVVRLDNLMFLLSAIFDTARWPVAVFPGLWRAVFTFVVPIAVMTTFPAMALLGLLDLTTAAATLGGVAMLTAGSRWLWRTAIRSYTSASS